MTGTPSTAGRLMVVLFAGLTLSAYTATIPPSPTHEVGAGPWLFFDKTPFINPRIVADLVSSVADHDDQVVAIDLTNSQNSNRYFGAVEVRGVSNSTPWVRFIDDDVNFGYKLIGRTPDGTHVLQTYAGGGRGGGTLMSVCLLFVEFTQDLALNENSASKTLSRTRPRVLIRKVGELGLGDRWEGELKLVGNRLYIGQDQREMFLDPVGGMSAPGNQPQIWTIVGTNVNAMGRLRPSRP